MALTIKNINRIVGSFFSVGGVEYEFYSYNDYGGRYQYWFWIRNGRTKRESRITLDRRDLTLTIDKMAGQLFTLHIEELKSLSRFVYKVEEILNNNT